jgi:hypothetical protein
MVYGDGCFIVSDDVVGHEITHGVTDYESRLFYYYQSGAINESLSDVWGEFVDLINGRGNDSSSVRWLMGEDISIGAIRSMSNPPAYGDPDRIGNSTYYWCAETDNGGVHINSGVNNKAAYLLTDGGTFNGKTVTGLGITKVAKIYYEAQTNLLLSASDYNDLYNLLQLACTNLIGISGITSADCQEVKDAVDATEMNLQPSSCPANDAPFCSTGQAPIYLFNDNLENPASGNWVSGYISGGNFWYYPQTFNPYGFDATYATSGQYNFWGYNYYDICDFYIRMNLDVALPAGSTPYLHFNHAYGFEDDAYGTWDGGVVEYSTNGGTSWNDAGSLFINNGYNGTIATGYGNPLGGRSAFVDESNGYYSSRLNLYSLAGQNVRFRFRIGTDNSYDDYGWFIDDIYIYTCKPLSCVVSFVDVPPGYWAEYFIENIYCNSITSGCLTSPLLKYCPESNVTRAEMAVFIIRSMVAAGLLPSNFSYPTNPYFTDVPSSHWAFKFIQKMRELGITGGCTATTYCPNNPVTRKEMAVFITVALGESPAASCTGMFNDVSAGTVGDTFCRYIEKFAILGITAGCSSNPPLYCPDNPVTRAQMAVFLTKGFLE